MTKADELREALGNVVYDAQTPDGLQSPSAYQTAVPSMAAVICTTLGITRDMVAALDGRASDTMQKAADALTVLLDLTEPGDTEVVPVAFLRVYEQNDELHTSVRETESSHADDIIDALPVGEYPLYLVRPPTEPEVEAWKQFDAEMEAVDEYLRGPWFRGMRERSEAMRAEVYARLGRALAALRREAP